MSSLADKCRALLAKYQVSDPTEAQADCVSSFEGYGDSSSSGGDKTGQIVLIVLIVIILLIAIIFTIKVIIDVTNVNSKIAKVKTAGGKAMKAGMRDMKAGAQGMRDRAKAKMPAAMKAVSSARSMTTDELKSAIQSGKTQVVAFISKSCPHCTNMMPDYQKACSGTDAGFIEASVDKDAPMMFKTYVTKGVPTVLKFKGGKVVEQYAGPRTAEDLARFIRS